jgi:hypothetical protein
VFLGLNCQTFTNPECERQRPGEPPLMAVYGNLTVLEDGAGDRLQRRYALPLGAAEVLTDRHSLNYLGALPQIFAAVGAKLDMLLEAYRNGGGVSWAELCDNARDSQAALNRPWFESRWHLHSPPYRSSMPCCRDQTHGLPISAAGPAGRSGRYC